MYCDYYRHLNMFSIDPCPKVDVTTIGYDKEVVLAACAERIAEISVLLEKAEASDKAALDSYNEKWGAIDREKEAKRKKAEEWDSRHSGHWFPGSNPYRDEIDFGDWYENSIARMCERPHAVAPAFQSRLKEITGLQLATGNAMGVVTLSLEMATKLFRKSE